MRYLVRHGVQLLQGYYIGMPQDEPLPVTRDICRQVTDMRGREDEP